MKCKKFIGSFCLIKNGGLLRHLRRLGKLQKREGVFEERVENMHDCQKVECDTA